MLHDFLEDLAEKTVDEIREIDEHGPAVVDLVLEVTRRSGESKPEFLNRILTSCSKNAKILKCADRISNLTDLHLDTHTNNKIAGYLDETEKYVIPMAKMVDQNMVIELTDLVRARRELIRL